ncbi:MAG: response regulator [Burkholderiaceae bacterium]|nr:response regulator [Rhodoferax sp.]MCP5287181.1 response regulator [Burkholderiaceae bacterium]
MRLLCVEDDRVNAMLLEQSCLAAGVSDLQIAETGQEALSLAAAWRPDLLVLDLHLPDTDGFALLAALRQALQDPAVPAVLCSADTADALRAPAEQAGFQALWSKPVSTEEVQATLAVLKRAP